MIVVYAYSEVTELDRASGFYCAGLGLTLKRRRHRQLQVTGQTITLAGYIVTAALLISAQRRNVCIRALRESR
jgi:hypothetical protein